MEGWEEGGFILGYWYPDFISPTVMWVYKASVSSSQEADSHAEVIGKKPLSSISTEAPLLPQGLESGGGCVIFYNSPLGCYANLSEE